jgi:hypothetical protein
MSVTASQINPVGSPDVLGTKRSISFSLAVSDTPVLAAGAGAGATPTVALANGSNSLRGQVSITTGTTALADVLFTITFGHTFKRAPLILFTPANVNAAKLADERISGSCSTTVATVTVNTTALADSTAYVWNYEIIGAEVEVALQAQGLASIEYLLGISLPVTNISISGNTATIEVVPQALGNASSVGASNTGYATVVGGV